MLATPSPGFAISVTKHNVELDAIAEWLEGCITFCDIRISKQDVKDVLMDTLYRSQDFAQQIIDDAWVELARRQKLLGKSCTYKVEGSRLIRKMPWSKSPAFSFCLILGLQVSYRDSFTSRFGSDYTDQGALFEALVTEAMARIGLRTYSTGWTHTATDSLADRIRSLAVAIGEQAQDEEVIKEWTEERAKDCGLDVVCHLPFSDGYAGRPVYFIQCASGEYWKSKRNTPDISLWLKLINLVNHPRRGIAHPFSLLEKDFRRLANYDYSAFMLDRHRISSPRFGIKAKWMSKGLASKLNGWTRARLVALTDHRLE